MSSNENAQSKYGKLYMMPCPIVDEHIDSLSVEAIDRIRQTSHFVVERARTARRFIKIAGHPMAISNLTIFELDKNDPSNGLHSFLEILKEGTDVGVFSEAGCPGIADPGHLSVTYCHENDIDVVPLIGPSSILLGLISSGMNGQNFAFNGYLPNKSPKLIQKLKSLEQLVMKTNQTQIFMEAPYRNEFMLEHCMKAFSPNLRLCIACDINGPDQFIKTKIIKKWKGTHWKQFHKRPSIFLIGK
jgi:16S rRNA (cytidine1402-2'-O)-methyltransferase